jgi:hypothetical protein
MHGPLNVKFNLQSRNYGHVVQSFYSIFPIASMACCMTRSLLSVVSLATCRYFQNIAVYNVVPCILPEIKQHFR